MKDTKSVPKKKNSLWIWILAILGIATVVFVLGFCVKLDDSTIELVQPDKSSGVPLMQAIDNRASAREFATTDLDVQTLSEVLWAAWGINKNGTRTIPTAKNEQNLKVFVIMKDGAYLYDGVANKLDRVTKKDLRAEYIEQQDFVKNAPLTLVYVGTDIKYSSMHAGSSYQNVGLYAASKGLAARVRGYIDASGLKKELNLAENEEVLISITVGNTKQ